MPSKPDDVTSHEYSALTQPLPNFRVPTVIHGGLEGTLPGGLRVLEQLGQTAEGSMYRAEYPGGHEVALVILGSAEHPEDPAMLARLREWFDRAIRIRHPNVAAVHEMGHTEEGLVYLVAECLTGELLSETLAREAALPLEDALDICRQAAAGLEAAHQVGCFHGNLSPETVLLTPVPDGRPQVKLVHFAQPSSREMSPEYASPERLAGHPPDGPSDVFSLAAVLHHLIAGVPPGVQSGASPIPGALSGVLGEALATEPDQRFQSIPAFAASLERAGVVATRIRIPRLGRAGVLGAAAVALALGVAGFWVFRRSQGSVESAALRVTELATRAVEGAESATHPVTAPLARPVQPPAARPVPPLPPARREASDTDRSAAPAPSPATGPSGKRRQSRVGNPEPAAAVAAADSAADSIRTRPPDSAGTSLTPAPAPPTW
ncbi:MAG: protein kinase domain-containing protein, partial [Gemmatimonadales bacterium]